MWSSPYRLFALRDIRKALVVRLLPEKWLLGFCPRNVVYRASFSRAIRSPVLIELSITQFLRLAGVKFHIVVITRIQRVLWLPFGFEFVTVWCRPLDIVRRETRKLSVKNWVQCLGLGTINTCIVILERGFVDSGRN